MLHKSIQTLQRFQSVPYTHPTTAIAEYLQELPRNEEEELYQLSLLREPRMKSK